MKASNELSLKEVTLCIVATALALCFGVWVADVLGKHVEEKNAAREARILERGCVHTGYYGRSGGYKTYSCHGWIVKEEDI